jgi:hypothetical protein
MIEAVKRGHIWRHWRFALLMLLAIPLRAQDDSSWKNVHELIPLWRDYFFVDVHRSCVVGRVQKVTDKFVTIERASDKLKVTIQRPELLQVTDVVGGKLVFSARSSWRDVRALPRLAYVEVRSTSGRKIKGEVLSASETELVLSSPNQWTGRKRNREILRSQVSSVQFIYETVIDTYSVPDCCGGWLHKEIRDSFKVPIFTANKTEDNLTITCTNADAYSP